MAIVQVNADLTPDKILEAVKQFSPAELDEFTHRVHTIRAQQTTPHLTPRETELLKKINQGLPPAILQPLRELREKMEAETISEAEHAELLHLIDNMEMFNAERLTWLVELAQLRNQTVPELIDTLGLSPQHAR